MNRYTLILTFLLYFVSTPGAGQIKIKFGDSQINLPDPNGFCLLEKTPQEKRLFEWQKDIQLKTRNKLLGMWIECKDKEKLQSNKSIASLKRWVIVTAMLSDDLKERTLSIDPIEFNKIMMGNMDFKEATKKINKFSESANLDHFDDKDLVKINEPIDLGVLAVSDAVHRGVIMNVISERETQLITVIAGLILINNIPVGFHFYEGYESKKTVNKLLSESKTYSARLVYAN